VPATPGQYGPVEEVDPLRARVIEKLRAVRRG
jgi:hypothetical protein